MKSCLGNYENRQGQCSGCSLALLCIDVTIAADAHYDSLADRQREIEEMEQDSMWTYEIQHGSRRNDEGESMQHRRML